MGRRRSRGRRRKSKIKQGGNDNGDGRCPPHPGFVRGRCSRCGAKEENAEGGAPRPRVAPCPAHRGFLRGVKDGGAGGGVVGKIQECPAVPASATTSIPRASDLDTLLRARKLTLILDLDHTLLNSTEIRQLSPTEQSNGFTRHTMDDPRTGLFQLDVHVLTKLRPFVRGFLEQASTMFEMHVYTLGGQEYARAVAKQLDPMASTSARGSCRARSRPGGT
ncbi:hypothetical protein PAHAL_1G431400 [Panicum hallii]|uniref:protein-serine/threonine phosphatase n=1 Tax=Panicum hallii TaxID=206008 RepID=A0A2T8KY62_9POAL|nr:hypothetical protein PAHAL_1G431400 [Panicum hallii]